MNKNDKYYFIKIDKVNRNEINDFLKKVVKELTDRYVSARGKALSDDIDGNCYFLLKYILADISDEINYIQKDFKDEIDDEKFIAELKDIIIENIKNTTNVNCDLLLDKELLYIIELAINNSFNEENDALKLMRLIYSSSTSSAQSNLNYNVAFISNRYYNGDIKWVYPDNLDNDKELMAHLIRLIKALAFDEYVKVVVTDDSYTKDEFKDEYWKIRPTTTRIIPASDLDENSILDEVSFGFWINKQELYILD